MPQAPHPLGEIAWDLKDAIDAVEEEMRADDGVIDRAEACILSTLRTDWQRLAIYHGREVAADAFVRNGLTDHVHRQFRAVGVQTAVIDADSLVVLTA